MHAVGVLHRDVKPSNVLMEGRNPILIDFGLARVADDPRLTHTGWLMGTPGYIAPEILHGEDAVEASDVHSWAATVAYAGTGHSPFGRGPSMAIMDRVRRGQHDLDGLPHDLREVVAAALDPDPRRRPSLPALLDWLRADAGHAPLPVPPPVEEDDPYTLPLALASVAHDRTISLLDDEPEGTTRPYDGDGDPWASEPVDRVPMAQRLRRGVLLASTAGAVAAGLTVYPWLGTAALLLVVWVLRSASLAASATGDRRRLRGAKWYDPVLYLVGAPWHAVRSIPGTLLLVLWSIGLALAAVLVCYAAAASVETTLVVAGLVLVGLALAGPRWLPGAGSDVPGRQPALGPARSVVRRRGGRAGRVRRARVRRGRLRSELGTRQRRASLPARSRRVRAPVRALSRPDRLEACTSLVQTRRQGGGTCCSSTRPSCPSRNEQTRSPRPCSTRPCPRTSSITTRVTSGCGSRRARSGSST